MTATHDVTRPKGYYQTMTPTPDLYCGVSHSDSLLSKSIIIVTEAAMDGPWTFGGERPATHCFFAWRHADGYGYRLDAGAGGKFETTIYPWRRPELVTFEKTWRIPFDSPEMQHETFLRARNLAGQKYDGVEFMAQGMAMLERFPVVGRFASVAVNIDGMRDAAICTHQVTSLLEGALMLNPVDLKDRLPERFARWAEAEFGEFNRRLAEL